MSLSGARVCLGRRRGMTLIEVAVAMAVLGVMGILVMGALYHPQEPEAGRRPPLKGYHAASGLLDPLQARARWPT